MAGNVRRDGLSIRARETGRKHLVGVTSLAVDTNSRVGKSSLASRAGWDDAAAHQQQSTVSLLAGV